jgi:tripartite-type tricarboxylate transporter receptor subunit TctC
MNLQPVVIQRFVGGLHKALFQTAVMVAAATAAHQACANPAVDWPNGPITFIVPFNPGGGGDTLGRLSIEPGCFRPPT